MLEALGIKYQVVEREGYALEIFHEEHERARRELQEYFSESEHQPVLLEKGKPMAEVIQATLLYLIYLTAAFVLVYHSGESDKWLRLGAMNSELVLEGQWYRCITALFLHKDFEHLLGNSLMFSYFAVVLSRYINSWFLWFLILCGGFLGNMTNALFYQHSHLSIGSSTSVFALIGLLTTFIWSFRRKLHYRINFHVILVGFFILSFFGLGGKNTDIMAHVFGFIWGMILGVIPGIYNNRKRFEKQKWQVTWAAAAHAMVFTGLYFWVF